jgi:hypothetical protein
MNNDFIEQNWNTSIFIILIIILSFIYVWQREKDRKLELELAHIQASASTKSSPKYPKSVFVFGLIKKKVFQPQGTCFVISSKYLLTVQHNMELGKNKKWRHNEYGIALGVSKSQGIQDTPFDFHTVKVIAFDVAADWAILELIAPPFSSTTVSIPITIQEVDPDTDFKVIHMPVADYAFNDTDRISAATSWGKTLLPWKGQVEGNMGLYRGSSGAPFLLRNGKAFAMHVESRNEAMIAEITEFNSSSASSLSRSLRSLSETFAARCNGLYFHDCEGLYTKLRSLGISVD